MSLPALMGLMSKASSIADLVRFFSESPLDGLRGDKTSADSSSNPPAAATTPPAATPSPTATPAPGN